MHGSRARNCRPSRIRDDPSGRLRSANGVSRASPAGGCFGRALRRQHTAEARDLPPGQGALGDRFNQHQGGERDRVVAARRERHRSSRYPGAGFGRNHPPCEATGRAPCPQRSRRRPRAGEVFARPGPTAVDGARAQASQQSRAYTLRPSWAKTHRRTRPPARWPRSAHLHAPWQRRSRSPRPGSQPAHAGQSTTRSASASGSTSPSASTLWRTEIPAAWTVRCVPETSGCHQGSSRPSCRRR